MNNTSQLSLNIIDTEQDPAVMNNDAQAWSVNLLASLLSGEDPLGAIGDLVGEYWARTDETTLIAILKGVFAAASMATNLNDIAEEAIANYDEDSTLNGTTLHRDPSEVG